MFNRVQKPIVVVMLLALSSSLVLAHHSVSGNFDRSTTIEITGILTAFHLRNPHTHLEVNVEENDGTVSEWLVEWGTKNDLIRRGVNVDQIKEDEKVTISLMPSLRLKHVGYARSLTLADGSVISDCGFAAFRKTLTSNEETDCEPPER
jgi:hypothetical protein